MLRELTAAALTLAAPLAAADVRIGVLSLFKPQTLVVKPVPGASLRMSAGSFSTVLENGMSAELRVSGNVVAYAAPGGNGVAGMVQFAARDGGHAGLVLSVPKRIERRYEGVLQVRTANAQLQPVVDCELELAVASSVAAETSPGTAMEALKAQAVAVRSYYTGLRGAHRGFDFCDTTHCQFFGAPPAESSASMRATKATAGVVVAWKGKPLAIRYCASCGGKTRSLTDVGMKPVGYPFYSVNCDACLEKEPVWESRLDAQEGAALLRAPGSDLVRAGIIRRLGFGALPGNNYTLSEENGKVVIRGRGRGHGVGLCQRGCDALARAGTAFRDILNRYFPETSLLNLAGSR